MVAPSRRAHEAGNAARPAAAPDTASARGDEPGRTYAVTGLIGDGAELRRQLSGEPSATRALAAGHALRRPAGEPANQGAPQVVSPMPGVLRRSTGGVADQGAPQVVSPTPGVLRREGVLLGGHRGAPQTGPRQNTMSRGTGTFSGSTTETTDVGQSLKDEVGGFTGSRTETTRKAVTGAWDSGESSREVRNGLSTRTTETSHDHLAGAEAWVKTITEASDAQLLAAFSARARAGAFSSGSGSTGYQRGKLSTGVSGRYDTMAGLDVGASGQAKVDTSGLLPALEAAASAYAKGGVGVDAEASLFARLWKLEFVATGNVSLFAGFEANAKGRAFLNAREGVGVEGEAGVFAGARGSASGTATLTLGPAELMAMASVEGKAGAWASASGKVAISFTGVEVSGSAEAFAGVTATASGSAGFSFRGKSIVSASGSITAAAGIGGKVSGTFVLSGGKLKINLGALAVKGIGGGFELSGEIDLYELGNAICTQIWEQYANYVNEVTEDAGYIPRDVLIDPDEAARVEKQGYEAFIYDFRAYAAEKLAGSGTTGLNRERVAKILAGRRGQLGTALTHVEADIGIVKAAKDAFGPLLRDIVVVGGTIRGWDAVGGSGIGAVREKHARTAAGDTLRSALQAGATATRTVGGKSGGPTHAPDFAAVNKVLAKHAPLLIASYGADKAGADAAIAGVIEEVYADVWSQVVVSDGRLSSAKVDLQAVGRKDAEAAAGREAVSRVGALAALQSACAGYAAEQARSAKKPVTKEKVAAIIAQHAGPLLAARKGEVADRVITDMVIRGLGTSIRTFIYSDGAVRAFEAADPAEVNRAYLADADAKRRKGLYDRAKDEFAAYVVRKTEGGENGVKQTRVQKIVDGVVKSVGPEFLAEADAALTIAARDGLGPMVNFVKVEGGKAVVVASQSKAATLKQAHRDEQASRGRFQGEDEANERRYTVRRLVYEAIRSYAAGIRGDEHGVPTLPGIQQVVDDALGSRSDVLTKSDARDYLVQLIVEAFDGVVTIGIDEQGRLGRAGFDMTRLQELRAKDSDRTAARTARSALLPALRAYAGQTAKGRPDMDGIDRAVDQVRSRLTGLGRDELDRMLEMTVMEAFGSSRIKHVTFADGHVTVLKLAR